MRIFGGILLLGVVVLGAGCYHHEDEYGPGYARSNEIAVAVAPPAPIDEQPQTFSEKEEVARLRRENEQLRMERDFLKKAAAFFAKESK